MLNSIFTRGIAAISLIILAASATATERIISAGSAVTELLVALGNQDQLVAVDITSELPSEMELPKIGYHRNLSAEGLMSLNPTLIIGSEEMGPKNVLGQLKSSGVKINIINTTPTPEGLLERIDSIASLTQSQNNAQALKLDIQKQIKRIENNKSRSQRKQKVLFLLVHEGRAANVAGANTVPDTIIALAGGINPAAQKVDSYKPLSTEAMLEMQPDVILVSGRSLSELGGVDTIFDKMPMLAATPAGKTKKIISIDGHAIIGGLGLKSLSEAERLSKMLNPTL
ncbi:hemin ABC transporter substrate-binding protein [Vibrio zhanjiangensis]|uniref:Hemin ABC transporter substrate-binding protein n=1 Tax=Vibrio zhanjiangensis TaxID=1046128 RepID=A0ABQ6F0H1_9VIBR|nr:ABC transporter substrate-binding protein [Vibrio zhanjiangensis]GLT18744.1 hemin ABC transporter substrate-binding protein [Vibrio zhanjiangensis]